MTFVFPLYSIAFGDAIAFAIGIYGIIISLTLMMDLENAFEKIRFLQQQLNTSESNVQQAAKYGKQLLDENAKLQRTIESLEQEKHDLKVHYENDRKCADFAYEDRIQEFKENVISVYKENKVKEDAESGKIVEQLKKEICGLHSELEMLQDSHSRLSESNEFLKQKLIEMESSKDLSTTFSLDFFQIENDKVELQRLNAELEAQVKTLKMEADVISASENTLRSKISTLELQLADKEVLLKQYLDSLQASKEEVGELKMEIETLKLSGTDVNRKGNSIFSEVEDRRKKQERELATLRAEYEAATRNVTVLQQQITKQKVKISSLHATIAAKFDASYVEQLESSLKDARAEINRLSDELKVQDQGTNKVKGRRLSDTGDDYAYLTAILKTSQKRVVELEKELQSTRLVHWTDAERISQIQKKNAEYDQVVDKLKSEIIKLRCQLEEFRKKCTCESQPECRKGAKEVFVTEIIPVGLPQPKTLATPYFPIKIEKNTPSTVTKTERDKCDQQ